MFSRGQTCRGSSQSPVVRIAEEMETKTSEAYRQDFPRGGYKSPGRNKSERVVASKVSIPEVRACNRRAKADMNSRNLIDTAGSPRRGGSDSTVTRACQATGEALLVPVRNHRSKVGRITGPTGKSAEDERVAAGSVVCAGQRPDQEG